MSPPAATNHQYNSRRSDGETRPPTAHLGGATTRSACLPRQQETTSGPHDTALALGKTRPPTVHLEGATTRAACLPRQQETNSGPRATAMGELVRRPLTSEGLQHGLHVSLGSKKPTVDLAPQRWGKLVRRPLTSEGLQHGLHAPSAGTYHHWTLRHSAGGGENSTAYRSGNDSGYQSPGSGNRDRTSPSAGEVP